MPHVASPIEDYALIGDTETAALVCRDGSIDWLCLPRFDSGACFAALLGTEKHGRWMIAPAGGIRRTRRRYREGTLVLETVFETEDGSVALIDFMPPRDRRLDVVRIVEGRGGRVPMRMQLVIRFDYGAIVPWVRRANGVLRAVGGPDSLWLFTPVTARGEDLTTVAEFEVSEGDRVPFDLAWCPSHEPAPQRVDPLALLEDTEAWWRRWSERCTHGGPWRDHVIRSLVTLKALTYAPTGGIVAAPTTSLPEQIGGNRNWDYRYTWVRDATFTLYALLASGYREEAQSWRSWLLRAVAGEPSLLQIMYGCAGERRLTELELGWLPGYEASSPVRVGNAAYLQTQLDVYGEVMDVMHQSRRHGVQPDEDAWALQRALMDHLESNWDQPDEGIWEVRGPRRDFTHSRVMAWVAMDRAIRAVADFGLEGPVDRWRAIRKEMHDQVCREGFDAEAGSFVQYYGAKRTDASLLMIPLVGFLPATDERMRGTVAAIERDLVEDGFVYRYDTRDSVDALPPGEGAFIPCTLWLADNLWLMGRHDDARRVFDRVLGVSNDVGLLSEEYDTARERLVGNFPQAFSHVSLVNTVYNLTRDQGPARRRHEP
jgi:GH15 family glucan-1,4-alpha-glucosidase